MKVIYAIDSLQTGGAENSILEICKRLPADIDPVVVTFYKKMDLLPAFQDAGIRVISLGSSSKYGFYKAIIFFKKVCEEEQPDLVIGTLFRSEIISRIVCYKLGIKNIGTFVNDTYSSYELKSNSSLKNIKIGYFWIYNMLTAKLCYRFISNAESIKQSNAAALFVDPSKIDVIYRGRDLSLYPFQQRNEINQAELKFINVGRLVQRKGQLELVRAFELINKKYPKATLHIAGEGPYRLVLEREIEQLQLQEKVFLLGNVKDVPSLLKSASFFVLPSYYEGFSGAIIEAMLCGIPILASDISMNKEALEDKKTGLLFKTQNVSDLARVMAYAIENYPQLINFSNEARLIAIQKYDIEKIANQHASLYNSYLK